MEVVRTTRLAGRFFVPYPPRDVRLAYAEVAWWGPVVAGTIEADDWPHTLRARFMRIVSEGSLFSFTAR